METEIVFKPEESLTQVINLDSYNLAENQAKDILTTFKPIVKMIEAIQPEVESIVLMAEKGITPAISQEARKKRLALVKVRSLTDAKKKEMKADLLVRTRAIDGSVSAFKSICSKYEKALGEIENHLANIEKERKRKLGVTRVQQLSKFGDGPFNYETFEEMPDDVWENYLAGVELQFKTRKEAEAKAEAERIAAEEARLAEEKRIREENQRLKAEAEKREKEIAAQKAKEAAEQKKRDEAAAKLKAEQDAKIEAERKEKERIVKELQAQRDAQAKRIKAEEEAKAKAIQDEKDRIAAEAKAKAEAEKKARLAPDKEKLEKFAQSLSSIELPELTSPEAVEILNDVKGLMAKIQKHIRTKSKTI